MNAEHVPPVVVAVDGTDRSTGALRYAVDQALTLVAPIRIVHVSPGYVPMTPFLPYSPGDVEAGGRAILRDAAAQVSASAPGVSVVTQLRKGSRTGEIVSATADARLLVIGHETRAGVERLMTGATTAKVAARAACPVVVVPSDWEVAPLQGRVVLGIKSPVHAFELLARAFEIASARRATLVVVHAWQVPAAYLDLVERREYADDWVAEGRQMLETLLTDWRRSYPDVTVETRVLHAQPVDALVDAGREADLILLARKARDDLHVGHLGGTPRGVLRRASCPVEVLPATAVPAEATGPALDESGTRLR